MSLPLNHPLPRHDELERLLPEKQATRLIGVSPRTLRNWRVIGGGPQYVKVSARCIRYRRADILSWIEARERRNTSQPDKIE